MISTERFLFFFAITLGLTIFTGIVSAFTEKDTARIKTVKFWVSRILLSLIFALLLAFLISRMQSIYQ